MNKVSNFFRKYGMSYFFLSFWLILFLFFTVIPIICAVVLSFTNFDMVQTPNFVGIQNYLTLLLDDEIFMKSLGNTMYYAIVTGPAGYLLSFVVAWLITETSKLSRSILTLVFYAPSLAGNVYMIWTYFFSGDTYGLINSMLIKLGLISSPVQWLTDPTYNSIVVIIVVLWMSMGAGFLSFVAGFQQLNKELFEAGAIDGIRNRWQEMWHITLPQMVPQLLIGAVLSISGAFSIGYQNQALTGNPSTDYSTHTVLLHMLDYGYARFEMGYASTVAVVLFVIMIVTWLVISRVFKTLSSD